MGTSSDIIKLQGTDEKQNGIYYEVDVSERPLGEGGTGNVRHGVLVDEKTGARRDVAIKFLYDDLPDDIIIRSHREALIHIVHENLIEMLGFVKIDEEDLYGKKTSRYHVISELLHGVMLLDIINHDIDDKTFEEFPNIKELYDVYQNDRNRFARIIVSEILSGVQALHDHGYIHRDIDPSNIMITESGKIKLIDLGIAKKFNNITKINEHPVAMMEQFYGKAAYAAPELVNGDLLHQDQTTDVYAIGILLYQIITGKLPFTGPIQQVLEMQLSSKMPLSNVEDRKIRNIIKIATKKKQSSRYQSASEFRVALDKISQNISNQKIYGNLLIVVLPILGLILGIIIAFISQ